MSLAEKAEALRKAATEKAGKPTETVTKTLFGTGKKGPAIVKGKLGDRGYSFSRAMGLAAGRYAPEECKEEVETSNRLKSLYAGFDFGGAKVLAIPFSTSDINVYHGGQNENGVDGEKVKFVNELREKILFAAEGADPEEMQAMRQKTFTASTDIDGGNLRGFPTRAAEIIELQRVNEVMSKIGVREITLGNNGLMSFAKQSGAATAYMQNEGSTQTASQPTTTTVNLAAKKMLVTVDVTYETTQFANPSAEALIRQDMAEVAARKVDQQCLYGTGSTDQVKGLFRYSTTTAWTAGEDTLLLYAPTRTGTNGWSLLPNDISKMLSMLPDQIDENQLAWLLRKPVYYGVASRRSDAVSAGDEAGQFVADITRSLSDGIKPNFYGNPVYYSGQLLSNYTKGSSSTLTQGVLGKWSDMFLGRFGVMTVEMTNAYGWTTDTISLRARQFFDMGLRHASSFVIVNDIVNG